MHFFYPLDEALEQEMEKLSPVSAECYHHAEVIS
jgi:hypothetical protein